MTDKIRREVRKSDEEVKENSFSGTGGRTEKKKNPPQVGSRGIFLFGEWCNYDETQFPLKDQAELSHVTPQPLL